jgi:hypothetical protein
MKNKDAEGLVGLMSGDALKGEFHEPTTECVAAARLVSMARGGLM